MTDLTRRRLFGLIPLPFLAAGPSSAPGRFTPDGQPHPLRCMAVRINVGAGVVTTIHRRWRKQDVPLCRLCDKCFAADGECIVSTIGDVPAGQTWCFSTAGKEFQTTG